MLSLLIQTSLKLKPRSTTKCDLSYSSLKCILEHIEANKRFQLALRCPDIRPADKQTPLHVNYLVFNPLCIIVNETVYKLGIYRQFPKNHTVPDYFKDINDSGGARFDLDRFGREDWESENVLTPGDIPTSNPMHIWHNRTGAVWDNYVQASNRRLDALERQQETPEIRQEKNQIRAAVFSDAFVQRDDPVPFKTLLQLTVVKGTDKLKTEFMEGTAKKPEAMKYLLKKFLDDRAFPIRVKTLNMSAEKCALRLPLGIQFHFENFCTTPHLAHLLSFPIFDPRSFPLHTIFVDGDNPFDLEKNHEHPVIRNSKNIVLRPQDRDFDGNWFDIVMKYRSNEHVRLKRCSFSIQQYERVVDMVIEDQREIGKLYSFGSLNLNILEGVLVALSQRPGAKVFMERRLVVLPMNSKSSLSVYVRTGISAEEGLGNCSMWIQVKSIHEEEEGFTEEDALIIYVVLCSVAFFAGVMLRRYMKH